MDARARSIRNILHASDQYLVPFFQRHYAWKREHWSRLWDDIRALAEDGVNRQHFLGPLVCTLESSVPGELPRYLLIDGQQRLTTLTILLVVMRDLAREGGNDDLAEEIHEDDLTHKRKEGIQRYKIVPRLEDRRVLIDLIEGKADKQYRRDRIYRAAKFFRGVVQKFLDESNSRSLKKLFAITTDQLNLVVITINDENPFEIFESLNSTGLPLEQADLVRNFLFMQVPIPEQEKFNEEHWAGFESLFDTDDAKIQTAFYRNYLMREGLYIAAQRVFVHFKEQFQHRGVSVEEVVEEFVHFAGLYRMLLDPQRCKDLDIRNAVERVRSLDVETAYPLLLTLLHRWRSDSLATEEFLEIMWHWRTLAGNTVVTRMVLNVVVRTVDSRVASF